MRPEQTTTSETIHAHAAAPFEVTRRRTGRLRGVLALGTVVGIGAVGTLAAFSDSATVSAGFTAGTLDIQVDGEEGNPTPYAVVFTGADAMAPGDTVYAPLRVSNVGTIDADLSLGTDVSLTPETPNATEDLSVTVAHTTGTDCDAAVIDADASPYVEDAAIDSATFSSVPLAGGADLDLCIAVTLPGSVTGTGGGASDLELEFLAEQA